MYVDYSIRCSCINFIVYVPVHVHVCPFVCLAVFVWSLNALVFSASYMYATFHWRGRLYANCPPIQKICTCCEFHVFTLLVRVQAHISFSKDVAFCWYDPWTSSMQMRAIREVIRTTNRQLEELQTQFANNRPSLVVEVCELHHADCVMYMYM